MSKRIVVFAIIAIVLLLSVGVISLSSPTCPTGERQRPPGMPTEKPA